MKAAERSGTDKHTQVPKHRKQEHKVHKHTYHCQPWARRRRVTAEKVSKGRQSRKDDSSPKRVQTPAQHTRKQLGAWPQAQDLKQRQGKMRKTKKCTVEIGENSQICCCTEGQGTAHSAQLEREPAYQGRKTYYTQNKPRAKHKVQKASMPRRERRLGKESGVCEHRRARRSTTLERENGICSSFVE